MNKKWLFEAFDTAYALYNEIKTGCRRDNRDTDERLLRRRVAIYSNFAAQFGLPKLDVENSIRIQITNSLDQAAALIAGMR